MRKDLELNMGLLGNAIANMAAIGSACDREKLRREGKALCEPIGDIYVWDSRNGYTLYQVGDTPSLCAPGVTPPPGAIILEVHRYKPL